MTEPVSTPTPEPDVELDEPTLDPHTRDALTKARNEARNLRERLKAAEEKNGALEEQVGEAAAVVSAMQLAEITRVAGGLLHDPDDLLTHQPDMTAYFDAEFAGMVSADRVTEQAKELIRQRPHLGKPPVVTAPPTQRPLESLKPGARGTEPTRETSWTQVLRG